ncbi:MAG: hypothetical protein AAGE52_01460 [Myxococcota bacterium]
MMRVESNERPPHAVEFQEYVDEGCLEFLELHYQWPRWAGFVEDDGSVVLEDPAECCRTYSEPGCGCSTCSPGFYDCEGYPVGPDVRHRCLLWETVADNARRNDAR